MKIKYPEWRDLAACLDEPIQRFESKHLLDQADTLFDFCAHCPVREACEEDAKTSGDYQHTVRGNRIRSKLAAIKPWIDPLHDACGTTYGPNEHRRHGEPNCTVCGLYAAQYARDLRDER